MDRIQIQKENAEDDLQIMFRVFDKDDTNCITKSELENIFKTFDDSSMRNEFSDIFEYFDFDQDGKISFQDFKQNMMPNGQMRKDNLIKRK